MKIGNKVKYIIAAMLAALVTVSGSASMVAFAAETTEEPAVVEKTQTEDNGFNREISSDQSETSVENEISFKSEESLEEQLVIENESENESTTNVDSEHIAEENLKQESVLEIEIEEATKEETTSEKQTTRTPSKIGNVPVVVTVTESENKENNAAWALANSGGVVSLADDESDAPQYVVDESTAAAILRNGMKERQDKITVYVQTTEDKIETIWNDIYTGAIGHTGNSTEGDYILFHLKEVQISPTYTVDNGIVYAAIEYCPVYYSTAAQEAELDTALASVMAQLNLSGKSEYEKICAIYNYITANVVYDYENKGDENYPLQWTAYAALINKTSVCQGYANLFYRMALEAGLDCRIISGISNSENHSWNIVRIGDVYYNVDATWDAAYYQYHFPGAYQFDYLYNDFLDNDIDFLNHTRDNYYQTLTFCEEYPISDISYISILEEKDYIFSISNNCAVLTRYHGSNPNVIIPETVNGAKVIGIGHSAFFESDVQTIMLPKGLKVIGDAAFVGSMNLREIELSESLEIIGKEAFECCESLERIRIPDAVTTISFGTFWGCTGLKFVEGCNSVSTIEDLGFANCKNLESFPFKEGLSNIGISSFASCLKIQTLEIPNSVKKIGNGAFSECTGLKKVYIGDGLDKIESSVFAGCSALSDLHIGNNVKEIGQIAFGGNSALIKLYIPDNVCRIDVSAFTGCSNLEDIYFGKNLREIATAAFSDCINLKRVYADSIEDWCNIEFGNSYSNPSYLGADIYIDNQIVQQIIIPATVKTVKRSAFINCKSLESVEICEGITEISDYAFSNCTGLKQILIPDSLESIGHQAFDYTGLEKIKFGKNLREIKEAAFRCCYNLNEIYFSGEKPHVHKPIPEAYGEDLSFTGVTGTVYYPENWDDVPDDTWGGNFTWIPIMETKNLLETTISNMENKIYTGLELTQNLLVTHGDKILVKDTDYAVSYENNINVGTAKVIITGKGNYSGTVEKTFTITAKKLDAAVRGIEDKTYTGSVLTQKIIVKDGSKPLIEGTDYTVGYQNNTNIGTATVTITGIGNYTGTIKITFEIYCGEHDFGEWIVNQKATCTEAGAKHRKCSNCGEAEKEDIPALDHTIVIDEAVEATCVSDGKTEGRHCSVCQQVLIAQEIIPALDHTVVIDEAVAPTCTETGLTEGDHCAMCGETLTIQEEIPATGHKSGGTVKENEVKATCKETGSYDSVVHCAKCDEELSRKIVTVKALGHNIVNHNAKAPTYTEAGWNAYETCSRCDYTTYTAVPKLEKINVSQLKITGIKNVGCTTTAVKQNIIVTNSGKTLKEGTDYTVSYKNNDKPGKATVTITGKGNYTGTVTKNFTIANHIYDNIVDGKCNGCGVNRENVESRKVVHMFRMYNPNTGEHFYTGSEEEKNNLIGHGWQYEGVGFTFPANTGAPVHRLFQPSTGEHLYTMDENEKSKLMKQGWNYEGIAFNSAYNTEAVQYRLHNPNAAVGAYHFTFSTEERQNLLNAGWEDQGIGWYSCWK